MKEFTFKINGAEYKCAVEQIAAGKTNVTVNGKVYEVETESAAPVKPVAGSQTCSCACSHSESRTCCSCCRWGTDQESAARFCHQSARIGRPGC